jgi:hypothetical protein
MPVDRRVNSRARYESLAWVVQSPSSPSRLTELTLLTAQDDAADPGAAVRPDVTPSRMRSTLDLGQTGP